MTEQEIFNKTWDWYVVQKQPRGWNAEKCACALRGDGGSKCAIGLLIPDDEYNPVMDTLSTSELCLHVAGRIGVSHVFLVKLLCAHDAAQTPPHLVGDDYMRRRLERFAQENNLTVPQ